MHRATALALAGLLLASAALAWAADAPAPPAGTWKITLPTREGSQTFWLVTLPDKDGAWAAEAAAAEGLPKTTVEGLKVDKDLVTFRLNVKGDRIPVEMRPAGPDHMLGTARLGGELRPLRFDRTTATAIDPDAF